jgi:hypothetical protein
MKRHSRERVNWKPPERPAGCTTLADETREGTPSCHEHALEWDHLRHTEREEQRARKRESMRPFKPLPKGI